MALSPSSSWGDPPRPSAREGTSISRLGSHTTELEPKTSTAEAARAAIIPLNRGPEILSNHLIIEHIVKHLPDVVDIINLRRTCTSVSRDVKHYLVRRAESLDFSSALAIPDYQVREFLRGVSNLDGKCSISMRRPVHQWDRLTHLNLSNTGITEQFIINIVLQTFTGVDWNEYYRAGVKIGTEGFPECFLHLESIRAQECASMDVELVLDTLQRLLLKKLEKYWDQHGTFPGQGFHVLRPVKSPIGSQIWRGSPPTDVQELENTGLIGYTRLKKLFLGNSGNMSIERDIWQKTERHWSDENCPFQHNVARWLCVTGALGIETELMFCHSYCDSRNAYLWDGWTIDGVPETLIDEYDQMRLYHSVHKQLAMHDMVPFPKLKNEDPMPRMPWESRIEHPSGRTFYFPGTGGDHKDQLHIDDVNISTSVVCTSAMDKAVSNFGSYDLSEQRYSLQKMTGKNWVMPEGWTHPNLRPATIDEGWLAYLFRYCLRERNFQLYKYLLPNSPRDNIEILPPYPAVADFIIKINEVEYVLKRMLRCPLPRRIFPRNTAAVDSLEYNWWDLRCIALIEYPRGLCSRCDREVWLCERCNRNPKAFCAECMISMQDHNNAKQRMAEWPDDDGSSP